MALGALARAFLAQAYGVDDPSHVVAIGPGRRPEARRCPSRATSPRIDADPVRCADPAAAPRWSPRSTPRRRDGDTLGGVVEVLAYGLPPGLGSHVHGDRRLDSAAGRRAHGDPGHQGRRGRRRLRDRRAAAARRPTTRSSRDAGRRSAPRHGPLRRHRGRHDHRRGAAGAGGDEADLDRARARCGPSTSPPARRRSRSTSARTCAPCRRPASSPRRWSRWCSPTPRWRSSAATRVERDPPQRAGLPDRAGCDTPVRCRRAAEPPLRPASCSSGRPERARPPWAGCVAERLGRRVRRHRRGRCERQPASRCRRHLRRGRRGALPGAGTRRGRVDAAGRRADSGRVVALGGGAVLDPDDPS